MTAIPFTPETLADRWGCSAEHIRRMYHDGEIAAFRLGKLIRITAMEVERIECQTPDQTLNMKSSNTAENSPSPLATERLAADFRLARMTRA
ncbi:MAG: hypothetical protein BVN33_16685 [Proteobacteria bacterium ST_bin13]|nr:MAG: hypothetical protein BVN33_16685 [Proteobacteria bacterium ST_bin13]